jgi:hypothetical protein
MSDGMFGGNAAGALEALRQSSHGLLLILPACVFIYVGRIHYKRNYSTGSKIASAGSFLRWGEGNASRRVVFVARPGLSEVAVSRKVGDVYTTSGHSRMSRMSPSHMCPSKWRMLRRVR